MKYIIYQCFFLFCFCTHSVFAQPGFDIKAESNQFYLINCCQESNEPRENNGIHLLEMDFVLVDHERGESRIVIPIHIYIYENNKFVHKYTHNQKKPSLYHKGDICKQYFDKTKITNRFHFYIISESDEISRINSNLIKIGDNYFSNVLSCNDLKKFSFNLFLQDDIIPNSYKKLPLGNPCFRDHGVYYAYQSSKNCDSLIDQYYNRQSKNVSRNETANTRPGIETDTGNSMILNMNNNIYPGFGYIQFNKIIDNIPNNASYIAHFNQSKWNLLIFPIKKSGTKFLTSRPSFTVSSSYLFDRNMNLIARFKDNNYFVESRYNAILPANIIIKAKNIQTEVIHHLSELNRIQNDFFYYDLSSTIRSIEQLAPLHSEYVTIKDVNYSGIQDNEGKYIIQKNFYLQKTGHVWALKDYSYTHAPEYFVLPNKRIHFSGTVSSAWDESIAYTRTIIHDSDDALFEVKQSEIVHYQSFISNDPNDTNIKNKIKINIPKWILIDGYYDPIITQKLNLFKKDDAFKNLITKFQPERFDTINGRQLIRDTSYTSITPSPICAKVSDILSNIHNNSRQFWEMHIFINTLSSEDSVNNAIIPTIKNKIRDAGIKRLCFWEFIDRKPARLTFYQLLVEKLDQYDGYKVKHQFISTMEDFKKPDQVMTKQF